VMSSRPSGAGGSGQDCAPRRSIIGCTDAKKSAPVTRHLVVMKDGARKQAVARSGLPPDRLGLGLDAGHGIEDGDGAVEDAEAPLHLDGK